MRQCKVMNEKKRCSDVTLMIERRMHQRTSSFLSVSLSLPPTSRIIHHGIHGTRDRPQPDNLCSQPEREDQQDRYIAHPVFFILDRPLICWTSRMVATRGPMQDKTGQDGAGQSHEPGAALLFSFWTRVDCSHQEDSSYSWKE